MNSSAKHALEKSEQRDYVGDKKNMNMYMYIPDSRLANAITAKTIATNHHQKHATKDVSYKPQSIQECE